MVAAGDRLWWNHAKKHRFPNLDENDSRLKKQVLVKAVDDSTIRTDFGSYRLEDGQNIETPCGCKRFCDCYGTLELPKKRSEVEDDPS